MVDTGYLRIAMNTATNLTVERLPRKSIGVIQPGGGGNAWSVQSVNGMTGHIVLDASDIGGIAIPICIHDGVSYPPRPNVPVCLYFGPCEPTDGQDGDWLFCR